MTPTVIFDINETTLDLGPVRAVVDELVGPEGGFTVWFQRLLQLSMTTTATGRFVGFTALARHALDAVAASGGRSVADEGWAAVAAAMGRLDPYPGVVDSLSRLRDAGWSTVALTNSAAATVEAQLERCGLTPLFNHILSVQAVSAYKPAAAPYHHALGVAAGDPATTWMVACHDWDLAGARAVGLSTAFVHRPGFAYAATFEPPELSVADFGELADRLTGA